MAGQKISEVNGNIYLCGYVLCEFDYWMVLAKAGS